MFEAGEDVLEEAAGACRFLECGPREDSAIFKRDGCEEWFGAVSVPGVVHVSSPLQSRWRS